MDKYKWAGIALVIGLAVGHGLKPEPEIQIKEVVKYKKQIEEKITIKEAPDGTKVTVIDRKTKEDSLRKFDVQQKNPQRDWLLGATRGLEADSWGISVSRRIISEVYVGAQVNQKGEATAHVLIRF